MDPELQKHPGPTHVRLGGVELFSLDPGLDRGGVALGLRLF